MNTLKAILRFIFCNGIDITPFLMIICTWVVLSFRDEFYVFSLLLFIFAVFAEVIIQDKLK